MHSKYTLSLPVALLCTGILAPASADTLEQAFADGKPSIDARYRYERVDDSVNKDAMASTLRTRLGFSTSDAMALQASIAFDHVTRLGDAEYNSTTNGQTQYAVVPDPDVTEINQAFLKYVFTPGTQATLGRQRIIFDNARFVGNVGWRQNEQTFDALRISDAPTKDIAVELVNIQKINTITDAATYTNINLVNAAFSNIGGGKLSVYAYLLDFDSAPNSATSTLGLRYAGAMNDFLYTLEFANQSDYADNASDLNADYLFFEIGYKIGANTKAFIAMEQLGSDNGTASFQTPLATKHAFNGWADKFLTTPNSGLQDQYIKLVTKLNTVSITGMYHDFSSDFGSIDYGTELDAQAVYPINGTFKALIKYASYNADSFSADTSKLWLQLEMTLK